MSESKFCAGCLRDEEEVTAISWCSDCREMVCKTCAKYHKRFSPPHRILPIEEGKQSISPLVQLSRYCKKHSEEKIIMFCCKHDCVICATCVAESHYNCYSVMSIEKAAKDTRNGTALADIEKRIDGFLIRTEKLVDKYKTNLVDIGNQKEEIKHKMDEIRKSVERHLNKIEAELIDDLTTKYKSCESTIETEFNKVQESCSMVDLMKNDLSSLKDHASDVHLFQAIKIMDAKLKKQESMINETLVDSKEVKLSFESTDQVKDLQNSLPSLGKVSVTDTPMEVSFGDEKARQSQVQAHSHSPFSKPKLTHGFKTWNLSFKCKILCGCIRSKDELLLLSNQQSCLYQCKKDGSRGQRINIQYPPQNITLHPTNNELAIVTVGSKGIMFVDLNTRKIVMTVDTYSLDYCSSITTFKENIWVGSSNEISILESKKFRPLQSLSVPVCVRDICVDDAKTVFFSSLSLVGSTQSNGEYREFYKHPNLRRPIGIAVDGNGNILVVGKASNNIHKISNDGNESQIILSERDGIDRPTGLSYNKETNELMVINEDGSSVNIYEL